LRYRRYRPSLDWSISYLQYSALARGRWTKGQSGFLLVFLVLHVLLYLVKRDWVLFEVVTAAFFPPIGFLLILGMCIPTGIIYLLIRMLFRQPIKEIGAERPTPDLEQVNRR
jgi:hypothetical protein